MGFPLIGLISLLIAFAANIISIVCLLAGSAKRKSPAKAGADARSLGETLLWAGHVASLLTLVALSFCCLLLVYCFLSGDNTIEYVVHGRSHTTGPMGTFYRVAGLWEGREGSLLFWAWLISIFTAVLAVRNMKKLESLDNMALMVAQLVLVTFAGILLFSEENSPFVATAAEYLNADGSLKGAATLWGMNPLLEHWAMAVHPPALFVGYAGLTIPFAYAVAALICSNASDEWVRKSQRYALVSWWFLGLGIGLGSVWAYVVLGWGGYWGWDPVENASLLPWLVTLALIHSFTIYRQRGAFKRWSIFAACLSFAFVITGTFITRSGLVESVHAFSGDPVSLNLFGGLIIAALLCGVVGLAIRWKAFAPRTAADEDIDSFMSREAAYYFNNVIMVVFAIVLCYLTVSSALPTFLPFGGQALTAGTYNAIARPLGVFYLAVLAVCPLLSWAATSKEVFFKRAKLPGLFALVAFVLLMVYFFTQLNPAYDATIAAGGSQAEALASDGPAFYYKGLAIVGFLVASLIFFNTLFLIGRNTGNWAKANNTNPVAAFFKMASSHVSTYGGYIAHLGMALILLGLIGSSMFITEKVEYVSYNGATNTAPDIQIQEFTLRYTDNSIDKANDGQDVIYTVEFDVYRNDELIGHMKPNLQMVAATQQTKAHAAVLSFPEKDLFVVYRGVNNAGAFAMDIRINPLISLVWAGFGMLMLGGLISAIGRRSVAKSAPAEAEVVEAVEAEAELAEAEAEPEAAEAEGETETVEAEVDVPEAEAKAEVVELETTEAEADPQPEEE